VTDQTKVFGLKAESGRWIFVVLGLIINLCLGSVYSWSVFRKPLEQLLDITATQSGLPYVLLLAFFAAFMPITGGFLDRRGPRIVGVIGGVLVGAGWVLSRFAPNINVLAVTYGVITGIGVGVAYGGPIAVAARWVPDRKGLAVGLTLVGFGLSAMITAPVMRSLIAARGPLDTFGIMGGVFLAIVVVAGLMLRFPPEGWRPAGYDPKKHRAVSRADLAPGEMFRTSSFYGLWICYIIGTLAGLMAIGISSPVGQEIIRLDAATAASLIAIFAVFNGIGRPLFGWLTDRITPRYAALISFIVILLCSGGMLLAGPGDTLIYAVSFAGFWLTLGGWLAIAPTAAASFFGSSHYARNYGWIFTAYGIGAIAGTLMSGRLRDMSGSYTSVFYPTAVLAVIGIIIGLTLLKPPKVQH
jgi:OFA family oxalate/formate antiporter-like MFS transporter